MSIEPFVRYSHRTEGKITIAAVLMFVFVFALFFTLDVQYRGVSAQSATSSVATTSVTVLNSPPVWTNGPFEDPASSTSTPTNEGDTVTWKATAEDPNGANDFFLLICKNDAGEDEDNLTLYDPDTSTPPECMGGSSERWARSAATADLTEATATYETSEGRVEDEVNDWYAFICDNDPINPRCNVADVQQGPINPGEFGDPFSVSSPFYVNFRPTFTDFSAPDPTDPGGQATWTSVAESPNTFGTMGGAADEVRLFVCRTDVFDTVNLQCDGGDENTYASSTLTANNPSVEYTVASIKQNKSYDAFGFVVDNYGFAAPLPTNTAYSGETRRQGDNEPLVVNNVAPEVDASSVILINHTEDTGDNLEVNTAEDETHGFIVEFTTTDANSCLAPNDTDPEMESVTVNVYRDGVGMNNCVDDADYNPNNCYPYAVEDSTYEAAGGWTMECSRVAGSCTGDDDATQDWECTFPLWYLADPTDGSTTDQVQFPTDTWKASIVVTDFDSATSTLTEGDSGTDVQRYTAFRLTQSSIAFGELEPTQKNDPLDRSTPIVATGNTGVDQNLEGSPMCPDFDPLQPNYNCSAYDYPTTIPEDAIPPQFQRVAVGIATDYDSGEVLADIQDEDPLQFEINVPKSTVVLTPAQRIAGWGIEIPGEIVIAGEYRGENLFTAVTSLAPNWPE